LCRPGYAPDIPGARTAPKLLFRRQEVRFDEVPKVSSRRVILCGCRQKLIEEAAKLARVFPGQLASIRIITERESLLNIRDRAGQASRLGMLFNRVRPDDPFLPSNVRVGNVLLALGKLPWTIGLEGDPLVSRSRRSNASRSLSCHDE
jgi:hypothetical protein